MSNAIGVRYDLRDKRVVLHPAVNSRVPETMIVFASTHLNPEILSTNPRYKAFTKKLGLDIPFVSEPTPGAFTLVLDAHLLPTKPSQFSALTTEMPEPGHWLMDLIPSAHRVTIDEVQRAYPQKIQRDAFFDRKILLKDVALGRQAFGSFAPRRLRVRTSKAAVRGFLSPRQLAEVGSQEGEPIVSFELSRFQRRFLASKRLAIASGRKPRFLVLKFRRGGVTTTEQGQSYQRCVQTPRSMVATLAHTREATQRIFRMVSLFHEHDPMKMPLLSDSKSSLEMANGSLFFIGTAGGDGFSRGDTLSRVHGSEVSRWCLGDIDRVRDLIAGIKGAAEHGEIVLETTANGREWFAQEWEDAKKGISDFTPIFLPWFQDRTNSLQDFDEEMVQDRMDDDDREAQAKFGLSLGQLAFRQEKRREFKHLFPQEYPEDDTSCFLTSGVMFFPLDRLQSWLKACPDYERTIIRNGYEVKWEEPIPGDEYVIGADTSEGVKGGDPNGLGVLHKATRRQVFTVHGLFPPTELAHHIRRAHQMYNRALIGVERQNHGHAVLLKLSDLGSHLRGGHLFFYQDGRAGWNTDGIHRDLMLDDLYQAFLEGSLGVRDRDFLNECSTFRMQPSGRWDHDPGCHDDSIFKWGIALQMAKHRRHSPTMAFA